MSRKTKKINTRDKFYIITNGEQTEKNYFDLLKSKKSIYDMKVLFINDSPLNLVKHASEYVDDANQVWCVFDIDNSFEEGNLIETLTLAKNFEINIAFSNLAFEVWLISHFKKCEKAMSTKDHKKELNTILSKTVKINKTYEKNDKELLKKHFLPFIKQAIENTKIVHQKYISDHCSQQNNNDFPIWKWNSCSNVYELVEALKLKEK